MTKPIDHKRADLYLDKITELIEAVESDEATDLLEEFREYLHKELLSADDKEPQIVKQNMEPVKRPETACPQCGGYMIHKGFELDDARTHIVIHYGCNHCGVHIRQHYSCKYDHTETDNFPDEKTRLKQANCEHHFVYQDTREQVVRPGCRIVWDNYRCTLCDKIEHRDEHEERFTPPD